MPDEEVQTRLLLALWLPRWALYRYLQRLFRHFGRKKALIRNRQTITYIDLVFISVFLLNFLFMRVYSSRQLEHQLHCFLCLLSHLNFSFRFLLLLLLSLFLRSLSQNKIPIFLYKGELFDVFSSNTIGMIKYQHTLWKNFA